MGRGPSPIHKTLKKGSWSPEEDLVLKNYIEKNGIGRSWTVLACNTGLNRSVQSCRSRWLHYLRPDIKHGPFSEEEDNIIRTIYNSKGSCWSAIAACLPGRTDLAVKNHWHSRLKKKTTPKPTRHTSSSIGVLTDDPKNLVPLHDTCELTKDSRDSLPSDETMEPSVPDFNELLEWYIMSPSLVRSSYMCFDGGLYKD